MTTTTSKTGALALLYLAATVMCVCVCVCTQVCTAHLIETCDWSPDVLAVGKMLEVERRGNGLRCCDTTATIS